MRLRGDAILARRAEPVADWRDPDLQAFLDDLLRSGEEHQGVGIAAPQVGRSWRAFILAPKPGPRYPHAVAMDPVAVLNPAILRRHGEVAKDWEGCLSVPGFRGLVPRHQAVDVAFTDRHGHAVEARFTGFVARIFQHEFDHLEGVLYPERMDAGDRLVTVEEYAMLTGVKVAR